jgi:hypothetical protein
MSSPWPLTLVALAFSTGCTETLSAPALPVPRPHAFQQFCEQAQSVPQASALAAARGAEGFELVAMYNGVLCYKRPVPDTAAPRAVAALPTYRPAPGPASPGNPVSTVRDPGF